ncbi:winged helix-turn-helix transcriptional regulator [Ramlibacter sp. AW1]|uniref:Winged helix-turn-helix transcriptional regulator n=1 Tax=Ramlibacter aurantiacus TaxID=2801330 RepID=A0A936ZIY1_9BURK|nr:MarR family winged helix-turn-helix transcriptional regulator [Ramlibacter aurantiacus]MBL0420692.1 winged helix-turn-helix transcriptional regulator [Ramlibacter aurantiacus]
MAARITPTTPWTTLAQDGCGLELEHFLSFRVVRLGTALQRLATREYLEPNGLTSPEWRILGLVRRFGPLPFAQVTAHSTLDKAQVSRSVKKLQERGLLEVEPDGSHAQRLLLATTAEGRRLHERVRRAARREQVRLLSTLSPAQRDTLWHALQVLTTAAGDQPVTLPDDAAGASPPERKTS